MSKDYGEFKRGVKCAIRAGLREMHNRGCNVALVAAVSTGIYANAANSQIRSEFEGLVNECLTEFPNFKLCYNVDIVNGSGYDESNITNLELVRAELERAFSSDDGEPSPKRAFPSDDKEPSSKRQAF